VSSKFEYKIHRSVGKVPEHLLESTKRVEKLHYEAKRLCEEHSAAIADVRAQLAKTFGHLPELHNEYPRYHVTTECDVLILYCPCPTCQAETHGVSIPEIVEAMYLGDEIPDDEIDEIREVAQQLAGYRAENKKRAN
jgi:hypothetical protein